MILPMFAALPVSSADAAVAGDAKSFADPVNAGSDKYYPTKTLQTVDFSKIKSDAELKAAGVNYLDVNTTDNYKVSYVDDGVFYTSHTAKGYLVSNVKFSSSKSYIVDFTFRVNPGAYILQASGVIPSNTDVSRVSNTDIDNSAFKIRPNNDKNLGIDAATYYSDATCSTPIGSSLGADQKKAAITDQADIRVKLLVSNGEWRYGEMSLDGKTYYIKTYFSEKAQDAVRKGWTGYFGFQSWSDCNVVFKNLTISECDKNAGNFATVVSGESIYRVAAGTTLDAKVYNKNAVAIECDGAYSIDSSVNAVAGKTYTVHGQSSNLFIAPLYAGSAKYYTKNVIQAVDFTRIKSDIELSAAGMTYLDEEETDDFELSYVSGGVHYSSGEDGGFLLSEVKMSSGKSYLVDFTFCADTQAQLFAASAAFPDRETVDNGVEDDVSDRAFKLRLNSQNKLMLDEAKYYSDTACSTLIGTTPDTATQEAAVTSKKDIRVRLLFTGGMWQYGEVIVDGKTYYVKANSAKSGQTGYFGFAGLGSAEVLFKSLTISECEANSASHAFVRSGERIYRVSPSQTLNASDYAVYTTNVAAFKEDGKYSSTVSTVSGNTYTVMSLDDVKIRAAGASAKLKTESGLRFASGVSREGVDFLDAMKAQGAIKSYSLGTLIIPAEYANSLSDGLTHASLDTLAKILSTEVDFDDVAASGWYSVNEDHCLFVGSVIGIQPEDYEEEYASAGYMTITMADDSKVTVYAEYDSANARSVSYVAACASCDKSVSYDEAQTEVLTSIVGGKKYYPIAIDGLSEYTVVYDADDSKAKAKAQAIVNAFYSAGVTVPLKADTSNVSGKGLYIGATSHSLSKASEAYYINGQIGCDGLGNIAVTGNIEICVDKMLERINELNCGLSKTLLLEEGFMGFYTEKGFGNAPKYTGGGTVELKYSFELSNSYYILVHNATATDYSNYLSKLTAAGYECYHSTTANGNKFSTYTDGHNILTLSHIAYYDPRTNHDKNYDTPSNGNVSYMTIAIDSIESTALPEKNADIEDIATEQITTVGTACAYVMRLQDGRFIVFDGGHTSAHSKIVYDTICKQNVREGKPTVAAWFLTHGHVDHIGGLFNFIATYSDKVEIEAFVHNLPAYEQYKDKNTAEGANNTEDDALYSRSLQYYRDIEKYYPEADIIVGRAGQRFEYGDTAIDVLFTCENFYKKQMLDTNGSSVVYSITGDSGRMLVLGDLVDPAGGVLNAVYGSSLKCDLVQVAHHGYNNGNPDMYKSMDADYAIWTSDKKSITGYKNASWRNFFDHTSVYSNIIPDASKPAITITENMTKADMVALNVDLSGYVSAGSKK